ncbi:MAG: efflux RND transporter periplasmic adaptor subunit [bacterium]
MKKFLKYIKRNWIVVLALVFILGFGVYKQQASAKADAQATYTVKRQDLKESLSFSGDLNSEEKVTLRFQTSGRLNWVGVKEGDYVKRFQTVATLDQRELKKKLNKELRDYIKERSDFDQTIDDYEFVSGSYAKRVRDIAQADLDNTVLDVEIQNLAVEFSNLFTPIEGIVTSVASPYAGVNITPAQAEFVIINPNTIYFSAVIDQTELAGLKEGKEGVITLDAFPDDKIKTEIKTISFTPIVGESGTSYEAKMELDLDNTNYKYKVGMTGDVEFILRDIKNTISVPSEFIKKQGSKKYIDVDVMGSKKKSYVTVGVTIDDLTQIKSGLKEGDVIYD